MRDVLCFVLHGNVQAHVLGLLLAQDMRSKRKKARRSGLPFNTRCNSAITGRPCYLRGAPDIKRIRLAIVVYRIAVSTILNQVA